MTEIHQNDVNIYSDSVTSISYVANSFILSTGQPFAPHPPAPPVSAAYAGSDGSLLIWRATAFCGRHKTSLPAEYFVSRSGGQQRLFGLNVASDTTPSELNFAFGLDIGLLISGGGTSIQRLYFGQGSNINGNNWWVGGETLNRVGSDRGSITITGGGSTDVFEMSQQSGNYSFKLVKKKS